MTASARLAAPLATPRGAAMAIFALSMGGFGIGTGEFAIMGLLPNIATEYAVSEPRAGYAISAYALGVVIGAPLIAVMFARTMRKALLIGLMIAFALGNFASALAPNELSLILFRFLSGLPHGAYFGIAALVAASIVPAERRARAVGQVILGLSIANVLGTPLVALFGQYLSWRAAFAFVGIVGLVTVRLLMLYAPDAPADADASPLRELGALRRKQVWLTLAVASIGFGGMFAVYSYIAPTLIQAAGAAPWFVPVAMAIFGVGMILGSIVGGWMADRNLRLTIYALLVWNIVVLAAFTALGHTVTGATVCVFLIGTSVAVAPAMQMRLMAVAADAQTLAAALNHSAFNMGNALGAWLGGVAIDRGFGWTSTGWVGAGLASIGLLVYWLSMTIEDIDTARLNRSAELSVSGSC